jgi:hypothetical protein
MKIFRGAKNLSPLKISQYYSSEGQFGKGMYFGSEPTQAWALSSPRDGGFRVIGIFKLTVDDEHVVKHEENYSKSDSHPDCRVEITKYEVIVKNPNAVNLDLISLEVGFKDEKLAQKLVQTLKMGEIETRYSTFDVINIDPSFAQAIHIFLIENEFRVI